MKKLVLFLLLISNFIFGHITMRPITLEKQDLIIAKDLLNQLLSSYLDLYPVLQDTDFDLLKASITRCLENNWHIFLASSDRETEARGLLALTIVPRFPLSTNRARIQNFITKNASTSFKKEILAFAEHYCQENNCDFIEIIPQKSNGDKFYKPHGYLEQESEVYLIKQL